MPSTRAGVRTLWIGTIVTICSAMAVGADGASGPAGRGPETAPAAARDGAVQQALRSLYTVPKASNEKAGTGASPSSPSADWNNAPAAGPDGSISSRPVPRWSANLAAPRAARPAPPAQRVAGLSDEEDLRSAGVGDARGPARGGDRSYSTPSIGGYRGFGQYGYGRQGYYDYRRSLRWPDYSMEWNDPVYGPGRMDTYSYGDGGGGGGYGDEAYRYATDKWGGDFGYFDYMANARTGSLLKSSLNSRERGLAAFRAGQYREAADAFRLACDVNQGDPVAQLYAGHALFAIGRYRDAVKYLRKALELQPRIVFVTFDMRDDYRDRAEFDRQYAALEDALRLSPRDEDRLFMLGYALYYGGQREKAYDAFARLVTVNPRDRLAARLMESCQPPDVALPPSAASRWP